LDCNVAECVVPYVTLGWQPGHWSCSDYCQMCKTT